MTNRRDSIDLASTVLRLFEGPLNGLRFPDVDADTLSSDLALVHAAQRRADELAEALGAAQDAVAAECDKLNARAEKALSYLRVYAEGKPELAVQLHALGGATEGSSAPAPRRRGRPRKDATALELDVSATSEATILPLQMS